jgi:hypothetical protein
MWSVNALDFVFTNPAFRNSNFTSRSGVPTATAARFTRALLEKKPDPDIGRSIRKMHGFIFFRTIGGPGRGLKSTIERAADGLHAFVEHVGVYHCCVHVFMTQQFLNRSYVITIFE